MDLAEKTQTKLVPGTYRLQENLPPLRKDARKSGSDWRYRLMRAGTLFFYTEWTYAPNEEKPDVTITEQRIFPIGSSSIRGVSPNESYKTRQLEELLIPVSDTATFFMLREHGGQTAMRVIDKLIELGKTTLDEVREIANSVDRT